MVGILSPKNRLFFGIVYGYGARTPRTRWSPHSGFLLIVLRDTKQLYFHFIGLFSETISGQRCTVLDLKKKKKENYVTLMA